MENGGRNVPLCLKDLFICFVMAIYLTPPQAQVFYGMDHFQIM